jgi:hypothetical protein
LGCIFRPIYTPQNGSFEIEDLKNWVDISEEVHFPKGTRHGTVFKASKAELEFLLKQ